MTSFSVVLVPRMSLLEKLFVVSTRRPPRLLPGDFRVKQTGVDRRCYRPTNAPATTAIRITFIVIPPL